MGHCREKWCMVGGVVRRGCREVTTIEGTGAEEEWLASGRGGPHRGSNRGGGGGGGGVMVAKERSGAGGHAAASRMRHRS
jgi:hypothetical protein